jgi:hypothetical protein
MVDEWPDNSLTERGQRSVLCMESRHHEDQNATGEGSSNTVRQRENSGSHRHPSRPEDVQGARLARWGAQAAGTVASTEWHDGDHAR